MILIRLLINYMCHVFVNHLTGSLLGFCDLNIVKYLVKTRMILAYFYEYFKDKQVFLRNDWAIYTTVKIISRGYFISVNAQ